MADRYAALVGSGLGARVAGTLGLPRPATLRRYAAGESLLPGPVLVTSGPGGDVGAAVAAWVAEWGVDLASDAEPVPVGAVVLDLTGVAAPADLDVVRASLGPALRRLAPSGRVVLLGRPVSGPEGSAAPGEPAVADAARAAVADAARVAAQSALDGIVRSVAKELRDGGTANLLRVAPGAEAALAAPLRFLMSGRSAYVDGQVLEVGPPVRALPSADWVRPLDGRVAVVTGAARGIGAEVARVLARDGAPVVCADLPAEGDALAALANEIRGSALQVDVTAADAGARIADHAATRHGGLDVVVHNAGITRDRLLVNTDADRWASVVDVNLGSILRMNEVLLGPGGVRDGGAMVLVSSIAGLAGNRGQVTYAASKAGVAGLARALGRAPEVWSRGITVNAVAPGFVETEMTARVPWATREVGRRLNSLGQGGLPVDVAEAIGFLAWEANAGVTGTVLRVCGQSLLGA